MFFISKICGKKKIPMFTIYIKDIAGDIATLEAFPIENEKNFIDMLTISLQEIENVSHEINSEINSIFN